MGGREEGKEEWGGERGVCPLPQEEKRKVGTDACERAVGVRAVALCCWSCHTTQQ